MSLVTRIAAAAVIAWPAVSSAADWPGFLGDGSALAAADASPPSEWSVETGQNVAWTAELPGRGVSGPIVVGDRVIVTASDGPERERLHVLACDTVTGDKLWSRRMWATGRSFCHPTSANAAPTPASDGERVFVFFSSNDLAAFSLDGDLLWFRPLPLDHPGVGNDIGMASSPVVAGDAVVVQAECQTNSFAIAVDRVTGETLWEVERPRNSNWASPLAWTTTDGAAAVWLQSGDGVTLFGADSGERLASIPAECSSISSPTAAGGGALLLASGGVSLFGPKFDEPIEPTLQASKLKPGSPTPVVWRDSVLVVNRGGVLACGDLATGEIRWRRRLGGQFWATPVVAADRAYCVNAKGEVTVVDLTTGKALAETDMGEDILGTPAVSGDALYFRSHGHLWKIATPRQAAGGVLAR